MKKLFLALIAIATITPVVEAHPRKEHRYHDHYHEPMHMPRKKRETITCHYHPRFELYHCHKHHREHLDRALIEQFYFQFRF